MTKLHSGTLLAKFVQHRHLRNTRNISDALEHICKKNNCICWYNWWKVHRYHLVPALRGFGWTGSNWAEIGHSTMKRSHKVWLLVAAFEDIADFIIQENNYISMSNTGKTVGKGPTQFAKRMKECRAQRKYVESACDAILTTDLWGEVEKHTDPDALFVPSNTAKHRVPKKFSTKNPLQKFKQRKAKGLQPEPVRYDEENDEDADNEEDGTSESDKDEYQQPIDIGTDDDDDDDDDSDVNPEPDDRVPPHPEPIIPIR